MEAPDTEIYAAQYLEDGLGEGFRIYTSRDEVYEARQVDGTEIRVYPDRDGWWLKTRFPVEEAEAYDLLQDMADTIGDETGTQPRITVGDFSDGLERGHVSREADGFTVQYRSEHGYDLDIPTSRLATVGGSTAALGMFVGGGAGIGGAVGGTIGGLLGLAGGPPTAAAGAMGGAHLGGAVGGGIGSILSLLDIPDAFTKSPGDFCPTLDFIEGIDDRVRRRRARKRIAQGVDTSLLERVNEKRALDTYMASEGLSYDPVKDERHTELEDAGVEEAFEELWTIQFTDFEQGEGVSVTKRYNTYEEAVHAVSTFVGDAEPVEQPSLYTDADALATILDALPEQEEAVVVRNALDTEPSDGVKELLDEEYGEVVAEIGPEWSLENQ